MLIGRDAGSRRMASTSALLSDKTLLRRGRQNEDGQVSCSGAGWPQVGEPGYYCFSTACDDQQEPLPKAPGVITLVFYRKRAFESGGWQDALACFR